MWRSRWLLIAFAVALIAGVCLLVERNKRPTLNIDHTQPFWIEFGRGSGLNGLDTVKIDQTGKAILRKMKSTHQNLSWEVATLQLSRGELDEVLKAVESNKLMGLQKSYHRNLADGTQWVLWIRQGKHENSVYFNNNFPGSITAFADQLDAILTRAGLEKAMWQPVSER